MAPPERVGLSARQVKREMEWLLRSPPTDPAGLVRAITDAIATVVEKNNQAIARDLAGREQREDEP